MKPIPIERRRRVLDDCANGMTEVAVAEKWKVSQSFIAKLKRHVRESVRIMLNSLSYFADDNGN